MKLHSHTHRLLLLQIDSRFTMKSPVIVGVPTTGCHSNVVYQCATQLVFKITFLVAKMKILERDLVFVYEIWHFWCMSL